MVLCQSIESPHRVPNGSYLNIISDPNESKEEPLDLFARPNLDELLRAGSEPAISIYLPAAGGRPDPDRDRLRFRAALRRAGDLLAVNPAYTENKKLLAALEPLARERDPWNGKGGGLALFHSPELSRRYRLPADFPELVVVGPTFHTRPLVDYLQAPDRYWVLELGQGQVRLWAGDARGVSEVDGGAIPQSMDEALGYEYSRDTEVVHRAGNRTPTGAARAQRGGSVGAFHGHGVGLDDREPELRRFFRAVDDRLRERLQDHTGPVVLAAVAEHHPLYRSLTRLESLAPEGIEASVKRWGADRLHAAAWPIAVRAAEANVGRALSLWEAAYGRGKGELDPANVGPLAVSGRVRLLLTERGRRLWGTVERDTGKVRVLQTGGEDPTAEAVELLDELSEIVLLYGGETLVVPPERMPTDTGVAAILR